VKFRLFVGDALGEWKPSYRIHPVQIRNPEGLGRTAATGRWLTSSLSSSFAAFPATQNYSSIASTSSTRFSPLCHIDVHHVVLHLMLCKHDVVVGRQPEGLALLLLLPSHHQTIATLVRLHVNVLAGIFTATSFLVLLSPNSSTKPQTAKEVIMCAAHVGASACAPQPS
jgi:hypothetical protein